MAETLRTASALVDLGLIAARDARAVDTLAKRYAIAITPDMLALSAEPAIARQFVPDLREAHTAPEEISDPIGDNRHSPLPGIVHRYPDRVLLKIVSACPVYCRFCFRRETVGVKGAGGLTAQELSAALAYIASRPEIFEVIITGGDPFILSARRAAALTEALSAIDHVKVIRWHTRVPMVDPSRVTPAFAKALASREKAVFVAIHANHPLEFTPAAVTAIQHLHQAGLSLLSQSVLLKGLNDSVETLDSLMRTFLTYRIRPYYLHHPDLAPGTSHWRPSLAEGEAW